MCFPGSRPNKTGVEQVFAEFDEDKSDEIAAVNSAFNNGLKSKLGSLQGHGAV